MGAEENQGLIFNIQKYSIHDGEGIRTNVFFKGCPLRCAWCANPESQELLPTILVKTDKCVGCGSCVKVCPSGAMKSRPIDRTVCIRCGKCEKICPVNAISMAGHRVTLEEVLEEIEKDSIFFRTSGGGVTLSGGEPLVQWKFAANILKACREKGIQTAIETAGYAPWKHLEAVACYADEILLDIKHMDRELHRRYTGAYNDIILENAAMLGNIHANYVIRIPFIAGVNADENNIRKTAEFAEKNGAARIDLLPYHTLGVSKYGFIDREYSFYGQTPDETMQERAQRIIREAGVPVTIGG